MASKLLSEERLAEGERILDEAERKERGIPQAHDMARVIGVARDFREHIEALSAPGGRDDCGGCIHSIDNYGAETGQCEHRDAPAVSTRRRRLPTGARFAAPLATRRAGDA